MGLRRARYVPVLFSGGGPSVTYFVRLLFPNDVAAPIPSPYTELGSVGITDASNIVSVSGGSLVFAGVAVGDTYITSAITFAHLAGRVFEFPYAITGAYNFFPNVHTAAARDDGDELGFIGTTAWYSRDGRNAIAFTQTVPASGTVRLIQRENGGYFFVVDTKLLWVTTSRASDARYFNVGLGGGANRGLQLPEVLGYTVPSGALTTEYGLATARVAAPANNTLIASEANCLADVTWTPQDGEVLDVQVRRTDDDNCWIVRCDQANSKIYLYEKQTGTETERGATGGIATTFNAGTAYRVSIYSDGQRIRARVNLTEKQNYVTAAFNATATGVKAASTVETPNLNNLIAWRVDLTGFPFVA